MLGDSCGGNLTGNVTSSNANIQIVNPNNCNISAGDVVLISDCETGHVFRANNAPNSDSSKQTVTHPSSTNQTSHLCKSYNSPITDGACNKGQQKIYSFDAEIYRFRAYTYFIRNGANGQPALWRYDSTANASGANPIELIEDIENMQITYGLDTNDDDILDSYANATTVTTANQWDKVISARVSLLAKTAEENLTIDGQTVSYNGADVSCEDGSLCRVFTSTIGIRNRVQ
jgi:type IV pilus assembly protein PilW